MPSLKQIQYNQQKKRQPENNEPSEGLKTAALFSLLSVIDGFVMTKNDSGIKLKAYKNIFNKDFEGNKITDFAQPLGDWLVSLPKGIWE